ncbi:MAG TPA: KUP/HAK/KT family potassium transporter [Thermodesulfovibrionales bacterium]|jgi:KUP system potassium uptake protein|nr:KUP/HAK/KT family potassium transporter [Thermodesulfovibrionales bacterium]
MLNRGSPIKGIIKSIGLVFGDIGTSPIYTLTVIFLLIKPTEYNVSGVLSLIVWTLIILVDIEYAWLAMSLKGIHHTFTDFLNLTNLVRR